MNKQLIVYHGNCTDGWTAAWSAWNVLHDSAEYMPYYHSHANEIPLEGRDVVFLDCCPPRDVLLQHAEKVNNLLVLDHHVTMFDECGDLGFCQFDMDKSGAGMSWDHFNDEPRAPLVDYVEDRDIWRWSMPFSREINAVIGSHPIGDFQSWTKLNEQLVNDFEGTLMEGKAITRAQRVYLDSFKRDTRIIEFCGHSDVPVVNAGGPLVSELLNELAQPGYFAVAWHQTTEGRFKYSLRSKGDFNVATLAEQLGGGGHKNAAAFVSNIPPSFL